MHFKFTTAGESHGPALIAIVEGVPAGLRIESVLIDRELWRRQQGYGRGGRMKIESDTVQILSGVRHGRAIGSPIALMIENKDFVHWQDIMSPSESGITESDPVVVENADAPQVRRVVTRPRPGHADLAGGQKFQTRDLRDILERASARETAARVAAGAIAKQFLAEFGVEIKSHVAKLGSVPDVPLEASWDTIAAIKEESPLRCSDITIEAKMIEAIDAAKAKGDTLGGVFEVVARGVPVGLGSHTSWEEKLDGRIARAIMSIHAVKAVEVGSGITNAAKPGSEVHDEIYFGSLVENPTKDDVQIPAIDAGDPGFVRRTNRAGGLEGGITNGEEIRVRGYMKPISTLRKALESVDINTKEPSLAAFERSDITAVPAAGVIGEAMLAVVLANSMREKFGGDSMDEIGRTFESYKEMLRTY